MAHIGGMAAQIIEHFWSGQLEWQLEYMQQPLWLALYQITHPLLKRDAEKLQGQQRQEVEEPQLRQREAQETQR
jgi:hypothetical protein